MRVRWWPWPSILAEVGTAATPLKAGLAGYTVGSTGPLAKARSAWLVVAVVEPGCESRKCLLPDGYKVNATRPVLAAKRTRLTDGVQAGSVFGLTLEKPCRYSWRFARGYEQNSGRKINASSVAGSAGDPCAGGL